VALRVHQLAKEFGIPNKELIALLQKHGVDAKSHMNSVDDSVAEDLRKKRKPRKIEMAPGFGGTPKVPQTPVAPVARPRGDSAPSLRPKRGRPLIIRSKTPVKKTPVAPARGRPGGSGPSPGQPRPGARPHRPAGSAPRKVMVFPTDSPPGGPPRRGPGRGGPQRGGGSQRGRRGGGRPRRPEGSFHHQRMLQDQAPVELPSEITVGMPVTVKSLSAALGIKQSQLLKTLMGEKILVTVNTTLTEEMLDVISIHLEVEIHLEKPKAVESTLEEIDNLTDSDDDLEPRAPIVTFLGHVDHGKTSLLDKIRSTKVVHGESGGITQHISAYRVDHGDQHVVFIDTPGHKAFTEMRARGANVTDVVVLVVAADDGPMPQTEEAIEHARAAGVPIVVAINKVDKENANINRTRQELAKLELASPDWGGQTEMVEVSAETGSGIDDLLEILSLETEILSLRANPKKNAIGTVLDSEATTGQGIVVTAMISDGHLSEGDVVVCGPSFGKVRTLRSTTGTAITEAGPSTPVEITGLNELPEAGDRLYGLNSISKAKAIAEDRQHRIRLAERAQRTHVTLEGLFDQISQGNTKEINLVIKTDVKGSLQVLRKELQEIGSDEVRLRVIRGGVGEISESDILLADASDAIVIGFHITASDRARSLADEKGVEIRIYQVIYQVLEEMRLALEGLLEPEIIEEVQGNVEILQIFRSSRLGNIAGCIVRKGVITRDDPVRLTRDGRMIHEGKLDSLRRVKDDAREVKEGFECGVRIEGYNDVKVGDFIESIKRTKRARTLDESSTKKQ